MPAVFSRHPGTVTVRGIAAHTLAELQKALEPSAAVADLSMGAWRGSHVAREWCEQLRIDVPLLPASGMSFQVGQQGELAYADSIGELVDAETKGDVPTLFALRMAERVVEQERGTRRVLAVVAPRHGIEWEPENELFLRLVAQGLPGRVVVITGGVADEVRKPERFCIAWEEGAPGEAVKPPKSPWILYPGVLPLGFALEDWTVAIDGGRLIVAPWLRPDAARHSRLAFDQLAVEAAGTKWVEAFAQYHGNTMFADCGLLCERAQQCFVEGGYDIAFRLLERATQCAHSAAQQTLAMAAMQGMRIAIHRFADAAMAPDPPAGAPAEVAQFLRQSKGWGLVMTGQAAESAKHFAAALEHQTGPGSERERLYLRNIAALSTARLGDIEGALEAELDIERQLQGFEKTDWHLLYINCLNLARLYRRRREFDTARAYYTRAFDTMEGARSDSDGLYVNLTFAQLETEAGNLARARVYWLRAALHWASCEAPEALAWRVATAALGRQVKPGQFVDEEVSAYLTSKLEQAFPRVVSGRAVPFTRCVVGERYGRAIGGDGWGVLLLNAVRCPASAGSQHARMRGLLAETLGLSGFEGTVAVPDRHGREMPRGLDELMAVAMEHRVDRVEYLGEVVEWGRCEAMGELVTRLGRLVSSVAPRGSELEVRFKRYLRPELLSGSEMRLVAGLGGERKFVELVQQGYAEDLIRSLEGRRIIEISMEA